MHSSPQASSIPAGFHSAMPYLIFDGTAAKAIAFYCEAFEATELPGRLADPTGRVLDAGIIIGDSLIRVGDEEFVEHAAVRKRVKREVRERVRGEVAIDDPVAPLAVFDLIDDRAADHAAGTILAIDAGVDMKDSHYCLLSMDLLPRHPK